MGALPAARLVRAHDPAEGARDEKAACDRPARFRKVVATGLWPVHLGATFHTARRPTGPWLQRVQPTLTSPRPGSCLSSPCDAAFCAVRDILRNSASLWHAALIRIEAPRCASVSNGLRVLRFCSRGR